MADELLTVEKTEKYLKVSDKTVRRLINAGTLIVSKAVRYWRIKDSDVANYLKKNKNEKNQMQ
jgi:excisionase family DNA binding protein